MPESAVGSHPVARGSATSRWLPLLSAALRVGSSVILIGALTACSTGGSRRERGDGGGTLPDGAPPPDSSAFSCVPGEHGCLGTTYYLCGADGASRTEETVCDSACHPELRCVECEPGSRRCDGAVSSFCTSDGLSWVPGRDCDEWGSVCGADGYCADPCGEAEASKSNVGCEYWPTPLANTRELSSTLFDFRVSVANPNTTDAQIRVTLGGSESYVGMVPAGGVSEFALPWITGQSFGFGMETWSSLLVADGAYRLTSDLPVIVAQFNPFEYSAGGEFSYTNDATLLLPTHAWTGNYVAPSYLPLSRTTGSGGVFPDSSSLKMPGYVAIVGMSSTPTRVVVRTTGDVTADATGRIAATPGGGTINLTLARGEVAHVAAAVPPDCAAGRPGYDHQEDCGPFGICDFFDTCGEAGFDLTGTRITADRPVAVFGGHVCAYVPYTAQACDHLEVQVPPIETWGRTFVGTPLVDGTVAGSNIVRVVAAFDGTTVTVTPPQGGVSGGGLTAGEWLEFRATSPFQVTGSQSVMVTQYLVGQYASVPEAARGDPAMTVLVPEAQYRSDYTFVTPTSYNETTNGQSYLAVVRPPGLGLTLDGAPVTTGWAALAGKEIGIVPVAGGTHRIEGGEPFGVIAYGMGSFTSYAYPAGLNLEQITILF